MDDCEFKIIESIGTISNYEGSWQKELNVIQWRDLEPRYDIRSWDEYHEEMSKGVTLSGEELENLRDLLNSIDIEW